MPKYKNIASPHDAIQGSCWVRINDVEEPQQLSHDDITVIPHSAQHIVSGTSNRAPISLNEAFAQTNFDSQGAFQIGHGNPSHGTQLVCDHIEFIGVFEHLLISHLPSHIIKRESDGVDSSWRKDMLKFLSNTAITQRSGSSAVIKGLSEIFFIQVARFWNIQKNPEKRIFTTLSGHNMASTNHAFHENFSARWTLKINR